MNCKFSANKIVNKCRIWRLCERSKSETQKQVSPCCLLDNVILLGVCVCLCVCRLLVAACVLCMFGCMRCCFCCVELGNSSNSYEKYLFVFFWCGTPVLYYCKLKHIRWPMTAHTNTNTILMLILDRWKLHVLFMFMTRIHLTHTHWTQYNSQ